MSLKLRFRISLTGWNSGSDPGTRTFDVLTNRRSPARTSDDVKFVGKDASACPGPDEVYVVNAPDRVILGTPLDAM